MEDFDPTKQPDQPSSEVQNDPFFQKLLHESTAGKSWTGDTDRPKIDVNRIHGYSNGSGEFKNVPYREDEEVSRYAEDIIGEDNYFQINTQRMVLDKIEYGTETRSDHLKQLTDNLKDDSNIKFTKEDAKSEKSDKDGINFNEEPIIDEDGDENRVQETWSPENLFGSIQGKLNILYS